MGQQIIKQPDGKFCVFSSISDSIIVLDLTREELVKWYGENARLEAEAEAEVMLDKVEAGNAYYQFTKTFEEAAEIHYQSGNTKKEKSDFNKHLQKLLKKAKTSG